MTTMMTMMFERVSGRMILDACHDDPLTVDGRWRVHLGGVGLLVVRIVARGDANVGVGDSGGFSDLGLVRGRRW